MEVCDRRFKVPEVASRAGKSAHFSTAMDPAPIMSGHSVGVCRYQVPERCPFFGQWSRTNFRRSKALLLPEVSCVSRGDGHAMGFRQSPIQPCYDKVP